MCMHVTRESVAHAHSVHELHQQVVDAEILSPDNEREVTVPSLLVDIYLCRLEK